MNMLLLNISKEKVLQPGAAHYHGPRVSPEGAQDGPHLAVSGCGAPSGAS